MRRVLFALTAAALAVSALSVPASAAGTVRMVDDDGRASPGRCNGNGSAFKTVQKAIDASRRDDTVLVCPGTYREGVFIQGDKDGLTLRSTRPWKARLVRVAANPAAPTAPIVHIREGADRVTVQHLALTWRTTRLAPAGNVGCRGLALVWSQGRDAAIRANRMRVTGDTLGKCSVENGILVGGGIYASGRAPVASALVAHNLVRDFASAGITASGDSRVEILRNSVRYWHLDAAERRLGAAAAGRASLQRQVRRATSPSGINAEAFGIAAFGAGRPVISGNEVSSGPDAEPLRRVAGGPAFSPRLSLGIAVFGIRGADIMDNTVRRTEAGIVLVDTTESRVLRNVTEDHGYGIYLVGASSSNVVRGNQASTGFQGIVVDDQPIAGDGDGAVDNRFVRNTSLYHWYIDCLDETGPAPQGGDFGTDNIWRENVGLTAEPAGICEAD